MNMNGIIHQIFFLSVQLFKNDYREVKVDLDFVSYDAIRKAVRW